MEGLMAENLEFAVTRHTLGIFSPRIPSAGIKGMQHSAQIFNVDSGDPKSGSLGAAQALHLLSHLRTAPLPPPRSCGSRGSEGTALN